LCFFCLGFRMIESRLREIWCRVSLLHATVSCIAPPTSIDREAVCNYILFINQSNRDPLEHSEYKSIHVTNFGSNSKSTGLQFSLLSKSWTTRFRRLNHSTQILRHDLALVATIMFPRHGRGSSGNGGLLHNKVSNSVASR
jgi:hypothetical protein